MYLDAAKKQEIFEKYGKSMCTVPGTRKAYELRKEAAAMELEPG